MQRNWGPAASPGCWAMGPCLAFNGLRMEVLVTLVLDSIGFDWLRQGWSVDSSLRLALEATCWPIGMRSRWWAWTEMWESWTWRLHGAFFWVSKLDTWYYMILHDITWYYMILPFWTILQKMHIFSVPPFCQPGSASLASLASCPCHQLRLLARCRHRALAPILRTVPGPSPSRTTRRVASLAQQLKFSSDVSVSSLGDEHGHTMTHQLFWDEPGFWSIAKSRYNLSAKCWK